jgi:hypothetical protein
MIYIAVTPTIRPAVFRLCINTHELHIWLDDDCVAATPNVLCGGRGTHKNFLPRRSKRATFESGEDSDQRLR